MQHGPEKPENPKNQPEKDRTGPGPKLFWSPPDDRTGPGQTSKAHGVTRRIFFGRPENPNSTLFAATLAYVLFYAKRGGQ